MEASKTENAMGERERVGGEWRTTVTDRRSWRILTETVARTSEERKYVGKTRVTLANLIPDDRENKRRTTR